MDQPACRSSCQRWREWKQGKGIGMSKGKAIGMSMAKAKAKGMSIAKGKGKL